MDLTWMPVAIAGCVAMAVCIALVLLRPMDTERRRLRPVANTARLTGLPEYVRAKRIRTQTMVIVIALLVVIFACATVVAARPTGLVTAAQSSDNAGAEDVMVCAGAPADDRAVTETLRYFADHVESFDTQRIGLTSSNRRVIPLTRDYQHAKDVFSTYANSGARRDVQPFTAAVSYSDYAESVDDVLAMCLTGFPDFDRPSAQRRSLIYVGPGELGVRDDRRPALFTADGVRDMAVSADVQVNALVTGSSTPSLTALARDTGGRTFAADAGVAAGLTEIRNNPPPAASSDQDRDRRASAESPDVPLSIALLAAVALAALPVVRRR